MALIEVRTQEELDAALKKSPDARIACIGTGWFIARGSSHVEARESSHVEAWGSSHVVARESSHVVARESSHVEAWGSSHVEAWGSSHVVARESSHVVARESSHVEAWGSSHVVARESSHVEAWGSSHVVARESSHVVARESSHVEAWGSSHVVAWGSSHVVARESSHVVAWGSSHVEASKYVSISLQSGLAVVSGGVVIKVPPIDTVEAWCDYYGTPIVDGITTLYKALDATFTSGYKFLYTPGSLVEAPDWDGGKAECGGGLHGCAHPLDALGFQSDAVKFVAIPVRVEDIVVHCPASSPNKVKFRKSCGPVLEVDRHGKAIALTTVSV
jgi:hypothetical protein